MTESIQDIWIVTITCAQFTMRSGLQEAPTDQIVPDVMKTLLLAYEAIIDKLRDDLKQVGLTEPQWRVLHELAAKTPMIASELAANTFVRASSLSRILRDLEARDLVSRTQQFEDLRKTLVSITQTGRRAIDGIELRYAGLLTRIDKAVGKPGLDGCLATCMAIVHELESLETTGEG